MLTGWGRVTNAELQSLSLPTGYGMQIGSSPRCVVLFDDSGCDGGMDGRGVGPR